MEIESEVGGSAGGLCAEVLTVSHDAGCLKADGRAVESESEGGIGGAESESEGGVGGAESERHVDDELAAPSRDGVSCTKNGEDSGIEDAIHRRGMGSERGGHDGGGLAESGTDENLERMYDGFEESARSDGGLESARNDGVLESDRNGNGLESERSVGEIVANGSDGAKNGDGNGGIESCTGGH